MYLVILNLSIVLRIKLKSFDMPCRHKTENLVSLHGKPHLPEAKGKLTVIAGPQGNPKILPFKIYYRYLHVGGKESPYVNRYLCSRFTTTWFSLKKNRTYAQKLTNWEKIKWKIKCFHLQRNLTCQRQHRTRKLQSITLEYPSWIYIVCLFILSLFCCFRRKTSNKQVRATL